MGLDQFGQDCLTALHPIYHLNVHFCMLSLIFCFSFAYAHPQLHSRQQNDDSSSGLSPQIWVPILVIGLVIVSTSCAAWGRKSLRATLNHISQGAAAVSGATPPVTRELTAEQLAGTINANGPDSTRPRTNRRTRRTPSQISTHSLPVYMKEPGEQELVIFRGQDMEDMPTPTEEVPTANSEDYTTLPNSSNDAPLLQNDDDSIDLSTHPPQPPGEGMPVRQAAEPAPERGPTPAYFEVVDLGQDHPTERRSSFLGLFTSRNQRELTHTRNQSATSVESSGGAALSRSPTSGHRPSQSSSGSFLSNLRRKKSTNTLNSVTPLTSPSSLSVNSISAPLTHTLQKTEFMYPRSGPTPEQVKLISSRDSFFKFGRPYGPDAIAYAASTSRQELEPPPGFEELPLASVSTSSSAETTDSVGSPVVIDTNARPATPLSPIISGDTPRDSIRQSMVLPVELNRSESRARTSMSAASFVTANETNEP